MKQVKRLLALALVLATLVAALPLEASAAGNSMSTATSILFGKTYNGSITDSNKVDYYKINLNSSGRITLTATAEMHVVNYYIYDSKGKELWSQGVSWNGATGISNISKSLDLTKGTYYLAVTCNYYVFYTGTYSFNFAFQSAGESFTETGTGTNNSRSAANKISLNNTYKGQLAKNDERDFYKFVMPSSGKLKFTASSNTEVIDYYIYDAEGIEIWHNGPHWNSSTKINSTNDSIELAKGTYYFVVTCGYYVFYTGNYSFKLSAPTATVKLSTPKITAIENVVKGTSGIKLKWGKVSGATKYEIYRKKHNQSSWTKIATVTGTSYTDASVRWNSGTMYDYSVVAVNSSARSNKASTKTILRMASPAMRGLTNNASRTIRPTWSQNKAADGYQIWYQVGENASTRKIITVYGSGTVSRNITGLTKGNSYKVFVRSFKKVNGVYYYSAWSASRTVKVSK